MWSVQTIYVRMYWCLWKSRKEKSIQRKSKLLHFVKLLCSQTIFLSSTNESFTIRQGMFIKKVNCKFNDNKWKQAFPFKCFPPAYHSCLVWNGVDFQTRFRDGRAHPSPPTSPVLSSVLRKKVQAVPESNEGLLLSTAC